jgi:hypothetical protein
MARAVQNSLGGNAKTALVITVTGNPDHAQETLATMQFGTRAKQIQVRARVNEVVDYKQLYEALRASIESAQDNTMAVNLAMEQAEQRESLLRSELEDVKQVPGRAPRCRAWVAVASVSSSASPLVELMCVYVCCACVPGARAGVG